MNYGRSLITAIAAGGALALALASASAAAGPAAEGASAGLTQGSPGDVMTQAFSPAGCVGTTQRPQLMPAGMRVVYVDATTICLYAVARVHIDVTLYRERWWGWENLDNQRHYLAGRSAIYGRADFWPCRGEHTYRGNAYHESLEGGQYYRAWTGNSARRNCF